MLLGIFYFHLVFGIHVEFEGSASRRRLIVSLHNPERHYAAIERDRAEQKAKAMELAASSVKKEPSRKIAGPVASASVEASDAPGPAVSPQPEAAPYWTSFRGPNRDGIYSEMEILTEWPDNGLPLLWRQKVGGGYASMVVADGKVFTIEQRREQEVVAAYELDTGREVWADSWKALFQEKMGGDGPRATPTWEGGRLYALGAMGELRCLEADTGRPLWRVNILEDNNAENLEWGMSGHQNIWFGKGVETGFFSGISSTVLLCTPALGFKTPKERPFSVRRRFPPVRKLSK